MLSYSCFVAMLSYSCFVAMLPLPFFFSDVNSIPVLPRCYFIPLFVPVLQHLPAVTNAIYFLVRL